MKKLRNPLAIAAVAKAAAVAAGRMRPTPRPKGNSRTADKFVIRGYAELFEEVSGIGLHHGRSINSEVVAALLDALAGNVRTRAELRILREHLGEDIASGVLSAIPDFDIAECKVKDEYIVRCPPTVRDKIRDGVKSDIEGKRKTSTMNHWMLTALVSWINIQRQHYALLNAAIAIDQSLLETQ